MSSPSRRSAIKRTYSSNLDIASRQSTALIFEFGSAFLRVGIAGEPRPRHIFPLKELALASSPQRHILAEEHDHDHKYWTTNPSFPSDVFLTSSSGSGNSKLTLTYLHLGPWISNLYTNHLLLKPRSRKVLIILPIYHPPGLKTSLEQIFLQDLQVPSILFVNQFRTIPYAIGNQNTGVMVDIGQNEGRVVCFFNGKMMEDTVEIVPIGYQSLLQSLSLLKNDLEQGQHQHRHQHQHQKMVVEEVYFNFDNHDSLLYAFLTSLLRCSIDLRKQVVQHVVFVGGGVEAIANFEQRFIAKIQELFESKGVVECVASGSASGSGNGNDGSASDTSLVLVERNVYGVKHEKYQKFNALASVIMNTPLGVLYPLQFRPALMAWVGGSIMGSIKLPNDEWIHRSN